MDDDLQFEDNAIIQGINNNNPLYNIKNDEFDVALLKVGSLLTMISNKRVNPTIFLIELLENEEFSNCFMILSGIDRKEVLLYNVICRFPILCKSKIIQTKIKKLHGNKRNKRVV